MKVEAMPRALVATLVLGLAAAGCQRAPEATCRPEPAASAPATPAAAPPPAPAAPPAEPATAAARAASPSTTPGAPPGEPAQAVAQATRLRVKRLVVADGVEAREPIGARSTFRGGEHDRVFAFVEVDNPERLPGEILVSFEPPDGPELGNVRLSVGATPRWRTWAFSRQVRELGEWTAVVRDAEGRVLAREPFSVTL